MLNIITWLWGDKYGDHYVKKLNAGLSRNLRQAYRFHVVTDHFGRHIPQGDMVRIWDEDRHLLKIKGCLARLRMFDPAWQFSVGIGQHDRIVSIDVDAIITGPLDELFDRSEFSILTGINTTNPCPYNGSLFSWMAGTHSDVWREFDLAAASRVPYHAFPDDQGWLHAKIPQALEYGPASGVYGFKKKGWPSGDALPANAKIVAFPGWRGEPDKFEQFTQLDWVKEHWREK